MFVDVRLLGPLQVVDGSGQGIEIPGELPKALLGLLAKGHPIGATGLAQVCEVIWQLRGEAGERQVDGAQIALTQNGGGWVSEDNAAASVHIFGTI